MRNVKVRLIRNLVSDKDGSYLKTKFRKAKRLYAALPWREKTKV